MATSTPSTSTTAILVLGPAPASQVNHCLGQGSVEGPAGQRLPWPGVSRGAVGRHPSRRIYATVEPKAAETYARARPHARAYTHTRTHTHTHTHTQRTTHAHTHKPTQTNPHQRSPSSKITKHHRTLPMSTSRCLFPSVFSQVSFPKCLFPSVFSQADLGKDTWEKTLGKRHLGKRHFSCWTLERFTRRLRG